MAKIVLKILNKYDETPKAVQIEELISLPLIVLGCAGMIAGNNSYPLFNQLFWQVYVALMLSHVVFAFWLPKLKWMQAEMPTKAFVIVNLIGIILGAPYYYMLTIYAFTSFPNV